MTGGNNPGDESGTHLQAEPLFEYKLEFEVTDSEKRIQKEGAAVITDEALLIADNSNKTLLFPLRDIDAIHAENYRIHLNLSSGKRLSVFYLGRSHDDFLKRIQDARNNLIKQDLLMHERLVYTAEDLEYTYYGKTGEIISKGSCNVQVSDTALIIATPEGYHVKFPLSFVKGVSDINYTLQISMDTGEAVHLRMLGRQREPLLLNIEGSINKLKAKALLLCQEFFGHDKPFIRELASLFRDGRGVRKNQIDSYGTELWPLMEQKLQPVGLYESYSKLKSYADESEIVIGFKRGLKGDLTGDDVWFMIPMKGKQLIAMEAGSASDGGGRATYFFKVPSDESMTEFMQELNYCLSMVNFRREPVYLTDEQLQKPAHLEYLYAIEKVPALRRLRELFVKRVIHQSFEQWQRNVEDTLTLRGKNG